MKFLLDAWVPPALVFGLVVAGAMASSHLGSVHSTDETNPSVSEETANTAEVSIEEFALSDKLPDPPKAPVPPVQPIPPTVVAPLASLPPLDPKLDPIVASELSETQIAQENQVRVFVQDARNVVGVPVVADLATTVSGFTAVASTPAIAGVPALAGSPVVTRVQGIPIPPVAPGSPLTIARVHEVHGVPSNRVVVTGIPTHEHTVNLHQDVLAYTAEHSATSAKSQEFEKQARQLADQIRKSKTDEQNAELKARLKEITKQHFDHLESQRREQIQTLESKIAKLKELLDSRSTNSDKIIERRMNQLLGVPDAMDFYAESTAGTATWLRSPKGSELQEIRSKAATETRPAPLSPPSNKNEALQIIKGNPVQVERAIEQRMMAERAKAEADEVRAKLMKQEALLDNQKKHLEDALRNFEAAKKQTADEVRKLNETKKFQ